jgi:hypothetical protein
VPATRLIDTADVLSPQNDTTRRLEGYNLRGVHLLNDCVMKL